MTRTAFLWRLAAIALLWGLAGGLTACGGTGDDDPAACSATQPYGPCKGPAGGPHERPDAPDHQPTNPTTAR